MADDELAPDYWRMLAAEGRYPKGSALPSSPPTKGSRSTDEVEQ